MVRPETHKTRIVPAEFILSDGDPLVQHDALVYLLPPEFAHKGVDLVEHIPEFAGDGVVRVLLLLVGCEWVRMLVTACYLRIRHLTPLER